jgi:uncharacterized protein involved in propanediol utilization
MTSAVAHGHAGEVLQGAVQSDGQIRRVLVSLPAPELRSTALFHPQCKGGLRVAPAWKRKSLRAVALTLETLGKTHASGVMELSDEIPVCRGWGSSTSDCVAAIRAVAACYSVNLAPQAIARIAQQAETSTDGTMFGDRVVAFLHCEGRALEELGPCLPRLRMLAVEPASAADGVCTDGLCRPQYTASQIDRFTVLLARIRAALRAGDATAIGAVASASAAINQSFLPKPHFDVTTCVAERTHAAGVAAAHSGTVLVLLYPDGEDAGERIAEARTRLVACGLHNTRELRSWSDSIE